MNSCASCRVLQARPRNHYTMHNVTARQNYIHRATPLCSLHFSLIKACLVQIHYLLRQLHVSRYTHAYAMKLTAAEYWRCCGVTSFLQQRLCTRYPPQPQSTAVEKTGVECNGNSLSASALNTLVSILLHQAYGFIDPSIRNNNSYLSPCI